MRFMRRTSSLGSGVLRALVALAATVAAVGCASMKAYTADDYDRGGASSEKYYKDSRACDKQAEAHGKEHGFGPYDPTNGAYNRMYDACMRSSGYTRKKAIE
jgi:hypothetical protein